ATGWTAPDSGGLPTGAELVERYLAPLAALPAIAPHVRYGARVTAVRRRGLDKLKTAGRAEAPFALRYTTAAGEQELLAGAVVDASGTYGTPNPLGSDGVPAIGEAGAADRIFYGIPDALGADRGRYAGRRVLVVGSGHSAMNAVLDLADLRRAEPGTSITWAIRRPTPGVMFGGGADDQLPARGSIGAQAHALVAAGVVRLETGFATAGVLRMPEGIALSDGQRRLGPFDQVVAATGFRPNLDMLRELRLGLDDAIESPVRLAPLIDPNVHSCGSVPPHGHRELANPEAGFYMVGAKSYGRAPTVLMRTGYEQVRSVVAAIAGDLAAADAVELVLPETGVCSTSLAAEGVACCGPTGDGPRGEALPLITLGAAWRGSRAPGPAARPVARAGPRSRPRPAAGGSRARRAAARGRRRR
ncbi:MAG TPA: flavoprotein, partial [Chloroflexota bacterium]